jgi:hypothetical protein
MLSRILSGYDLYSDSPASTTGSVVDVRHVEQNVQLRLCYNNDNFIVKSVLTEPLWDQLLCSEFTGNI